MDFSPSARCQELMAATRAFLDEVIYPAEPVFHRQVAENRAAGEPFQTPAVMGRLKEAARKRGLWNLFLPDEKFGAGLPVLDYAPVAELTGRSPELAPEAMNCAAPDTGNMEVLALFGTPEQQERWLMPLLDGRIRSCFSMTERMWPHPTPRISTRGSPATVLSTSSTAANGGPPARCAPSARSPS